MTRVRTRRAQSFRLPHLLLHPSFTKTLAMPLAPHRQTFLVLRHASLPPTPFWQPASVPLAQFILPFLSCPTPTSSFVFYVQFSPRHADLRVGPAVAPVATTSAAKTAPQSVLFLGCNVWLALARLHPLTDILHVDRVDPLQTRS